MRFINDDVQLKNGGRKAARVTAVDLWRMILQRATLLAEDEDTLKELQKAVELEDNQAMYRALEVLHTCDRLIVAGNKFNADVKNLLIGANGHVCECAYDDNDIGEPLIGLQTLPNGLTFYGYMAGGDWEYPVFLIIYFDGKKLRSYTPAYGNCVNLDCHTAFGSEGDSKKNIDYEKLKAKYIKRGWNFDDDGNELDTDDSDFMYRCYLNKYELTYDTLGFNWDAIRKDIEARIEVVGAPCTNPTVDAKNPEQKSPTEKTKNKHQRIWMEKVFPQFITAVLENPTKKVTMLLSKNGAEVARMNIDFERQCHIITGVIHKSLQQYMNEAGECLVQNPEQMAPMLNAADAHSIVLEDDPNHRPLQMQNDGEKCHMTDKMKDMFVAMQTLMNLSQAEPQKILVLQMKLRNNQEAQIVKMPSAVLLRGFIPVELRCYVGFLGILYCSNIETVMSAFAYLLESYEIGECTII